MINGCLSRMEDGHAAKHVKTNYLDGENAVIIKQ